MSYQRSTTEILADLTAYRAARTALVTGERVEDVWRDGRRMRLTTMSLQEISQAIAELQVEYQQASSVEAGGPRRSAIGTYF